MAELKEDQEGYNPFDSENAPAFQLIMQMRIYDVLMAILSHLDEKTADLVYDAHQEGKIVSGLPSFVPKEKDE